VGSKISLLFFFRIANIKLNRKIRYVMCKNSIELPKYKCHKIVHALKIKSIDIVSNIGNGTDDYATITPDFF